MTEEITLEKIKERLAMMKRTPNANASYSMAASDMEWLIEKVEELENTIKTQKDTVLLHIQNERDVSKENTKLKKVVEAAKNLRVVQDPEDNSYFLHDWHTKLLEITTALADGSEDLKWAMN